VYHSPVAKKHAGMDDLATLREYLREISKLPLLTADEEHELGVRIQQDKDEEAFRRLVESNLRFVVSYAKRYRGLGVPFLDLIHEGNVGLIEAARRFDPNRNVKFITYAVWWVRQAIMQALSDQARIFSIPAKLSPVAARFRREVAALAAELDHSPSSQEIAADLEISESDADALMQITGADVSLNDRIAPGPDDEGRELGETLQQHTVPLIEDELIRRAVVVQIHSALAELEPKEQEVMRLRFGLEGGEPQTLQQIGDRLGVTRERVRQIEVRAKEKLRRSQKAQELRVRLN
jgi:RNA polymerase primary sigma factor